MKYLLDTHVFIWFFEDDTRLSETAKRIILDRSCQKFISIASLWEIIIKINIEKYHFEGGANEMIRLIILNDFETLPVKYSYLLKYENFPLIHRDPFDRLLVVTALAEDMTIITADKNIHEYNVKWVW